MRPLAFVLLAFSLSACGAKVVGGTTPVEFAQIDLAARVKTALLNDMELRDRRIDVQAINGSVTLTGRVATSGERDRAVTLAKAVQGVTEVKTLLEIRP